MDLSIIERVFALREEMEKAQLGVDSPDLAEPGREADPELFKRLSQTPDERVAAGFMARALELEAESAQWIESANAPERRSRQDVVELLAAATAPLPAFKPTDFATVVVEPGREPGREPEREPGRGPEREPGHTPGREPGRDLVRDTMRDTMRDTTVRDAPPPTAGATPTKPARKTPKKKSKQPKKPKKPE
ncbi:MAG TPA: hypothetical protein VKA54_06135 [Gemmatimonadaceae bacterium]|nr:hypothetical protein [Gemmatimonadaceae bacterium]